MLLIVEGEEKEPTLELWGKVYHRQRPEVSTVGTFMSGPYEI